MPVAYPSRRVPLAVIACVALTSAACDGRTPSAPVIPVPGPVTSVSGQIVELLPSGREGLPVPGVRVEVVAKPGVVSAALTDASGGYSIDGVAGTFELRAAKAGYRVATSTVRNVNEPRTHDIRLEPIPGTLTGRVTETTPTQHVPIAGARITVVSGSNAGATAVSAADGVYSLPGLWGEFDLRVEGDQYDPATVHVAMASAETRVDVQLLPVGRDVVHEFPMTNGRFEPLYLLIRVHRAGEIAITDWLAYGFEEGDGTTLQIWEDGRLLAQTFVERSFPRHTTVLRAAAVPGRTYEVRSVRSWWWYTATIRHPY